jgi:two-component system OmpR family response regulator
MIDFPDLAPAEVGSTSKVVSAGVAPLRHPFRARNAAPWRTEKGNPAKKYGKPVAVGRGWVGTSGAAVYSDGMKRIAIVEDEPAIRANYTEALRRHGYEVAAYANRADAMKAFRTRLPDLALVDIGLGEDIDGGFALTRELRALSATLPIIFLSARDSDFDIVAGLRLGADDYLTKDASLPHLAARIAALFRRSELSSALPAREDILERGPLALDVPRLTARWNGVRVDLTLTEFWMVHSLARFPGHVKDRDALMRDASIVVDDSTITSHVKRIRRKFQAVDPAFDHIATVYGMGYRWNAE